MFRYPPCIAKFFLGVEILMLNTFVGSQLKIKGRGGVLFIRFEIFIVFRTWFEVHTTELLFKDTLILSARLHTISED